MDVVVNGVTGSLQWEGFRKGRHDGGPQVVIRYLVNYFYADQFADGVFGGFVKSGGAGGTIHYLPRMACPTNPTLYAIDVDVDYAGEIPDAPPTYTPPALPPPSQIAFQAAIVTVVYGNTPWPQFSTDDPGGEQSFQLESQPNEPLLGMECEIDHGGQAISLPNRALAFDDGTPFGPDDPGMIRWESLDVWRVTRHNFPNLPWATVRKLKNKLNDDTFLGQPKGCVRFANARSAGTMTGQGFKCQRFDIIFEVKSQDWNMKIRPDDGTYGLVTLLRDGTVNPYKYDDLRGLLA